MQILIWIIIIIVAIFLIRLLRRWIKRLIFIAILLVLAFFIYGIFNPSGAGKLWYNIRTLPQRITSKFSNQNFINYEEYKSNLSEIGDKIKLNTNDDEPNEISNGKEDTEPQNSNHEDDNSEKNETTVDESKHTDNENKLQPFPEMIKFSSLTKLIEKKDNKPTIGYKKSELLGIINGYIQNHLNDNTDILVTIEYEDDYNDPQKIILQTEPKNNTGLNISQIGLIENGSEGNIQAQKDEKTSSEAIKNGNHLSQEDMKEAEDIFSVLF